MISGTIDDQVASSKTPQQKNEMQKKHLQIEGPRSLATITEGPHNLSRQSK